LKIQSHTRGLQLSIRSAVAAGVALTIADLCRLDFPIYAMIAAVIVTDLSPAQSRTLAFQRLAGTVIGGIFGAGMSALLPHTAWAIASGIFCAMLICYPARIPAGAKIAGYTCGIIMLSFNSEPWAYALYRFFETILGIVVALAVSVVPKLLTTEEKSSASH